MPNVGLIGAGNVAWNLSGALHGSAYQIVQVIHPRLEPAQALAEAYGIAQANAQPADLRQDLDVVFIVTNDHTIAEIAETYAPFRAADTIFVHSSGSIALDALAPLGERIGIVYPMQTFTKGHQADFRDIPVFLEGTEAVLEVIRPLAETMSEKVQVLTSEERLRLHLGAVFASNFLNFMLLLSEEAVGPLAGLDLKVYEPLVRECIEKAFRYGPKAAHTGPARRGDQVTMQKHLDLLGENSGDSRVAELYRMLSCMIGDRFQ